MFSVFKAILGICNTKPLGSGWDLKDGRLSVTSEGLAEMDRLGGAAYLQGGGLEKPVLLLKMGADDYLTFENKCTHGGRKIDLKPDHTGLRCCSVNHSTYDLEGKNLTGPARGPVIKYRIAFKDGELSVILSV